MNKVNLLLTSCLIASLSACGTSEERVDNARISGCFQEEKTVSTEAIRLQVKNGKLLFAHINRLVSCDAEGCSVAIEVEGDLLRLTEKWRAKKEVNCLCRMNVDYEDKAPQSGKYRIEVLSEGEVLLSLPAQELKEGFSLEQIMDAEQ